MFPCELSIAIGTTSNLSAQSTFDIFYTAAVVELELLSESDDETPTYINQMLEIINSHAVKAADVIVLPETLLNRATANIFVPNSTIFCYHPNSQAQ